MSMAHNWQKLPDGSINYWAMDQYASPHHGPRCIGCGAEFCIECTPELIDSDCSWFLPSN